MRRRKLSNVTKSHPLYSTPGKTGDWRGSGISGTELNTTVQGWSSEMRSKVLKTRNDYGYQQRNTTYGSDPFWPLGYESINTTYGRKTKMNNCRHLKQRMHSLPITVYRKYNRTFHYFESYYRLPLLTGFYKDALNVALGHEMSVDRSSDLQFSARAYWSMRPKFKGDVQLLNSIFEIKDFVDPLSFLGKRWLDIKELLTQTNTRKHIRSLKQLGTAALSLPFSALATLLSGAQLAWLAIKPTIADAIGIHAAMQKDIFALAKQFNEFGEAGARSHYSEYQELTRRLTRETGKRYGYAYGSYTNVTRTATAVFHQQLLWQKLEDAYPHWWGLEMGFDEIWNMLPLSFVLDYVLTVGKSLEIMDRDDRVKVHVMEYCESIKIEASMGSYVIRDAYIPALMVDGDELPYTESGRPLLVTGTAGTVYQRTVKEPYRGPALPRLKLPSFNQGLNLAALAHCFFIHDSNTGEFLAR